MVKKTAMCGEETKFCISKLNVWIMSWQFQGSKIKLPNDSQLLKYFIKVSN